MNHTYIKKSLICLFAFVLMLGAISAQKVEYRVTKNTNVNQLSTINVSQIEDVYLAQINCTEPAEKSSSSYRSELEAVKSRISELYPKSDQKTSKTRNSVSTPEILDAFPIENISRGIPLDNHLAVSDEYILTAGNFFVSINSKDQTQLETFTLLSFSEAANVEGFPFDPRLVYDKANGRWILNFLAGFESSLTDVVIAVSATNDPLGEWYVYSIVGNPNELNEWTDYPMISITDDHIYVTINLLRDNETWQEGFVETIIWEVEKSSAYDGQNIAVTKYDNISINGQTIRNVCPAENATDEIYKDIYFISDRNFAIENDTFILMKIDPSTTDPELNLTAQYVLSDLPYGAPPNAEQKVGTLATNDARVLEAFRLDNQLQFVGNTRNLDNNKAGIFHGILNDLENPTTINLNHIIGDDYELGYPGIIYTGQSQDENDAIIVVSHVSKDKFPGISSFYSYPGEGYSDLISVVEGEDYIDMQQNTTLERWGDYAGSQRDYYSPGEVFVSSTSCDFFRRNIPYVAHLKRPSSPTGVFNTTKLKQEYTVYPNPTIKRISVDFNLDQKVESINARLYNIKGEYLDEIFHSTYIKPGVNTFSFDTSHLNSGTYILKILLDGESITSKTFQKS